MNVTRRSLLKAAVGATQLGLLGSAGLMPGKARGAPSSGPTKLVTLFMPGGWMPMYLWCPLSAAEIAYAIPAPTTRSNEPVFFTANQVTNLDGSGDALNGGFQRIRSPKLWNESALAAGRPDPRTGTSPNGWAWSQYRLWENTAVVHGVDMGTASHMAGAVSALCGVAGDQFRSPAINALVANALFDRFATTRPLPSVSISGLTPESLYLRPEAGPISVASAAEVRYTLSQRVDPSWLNLRNRTSQPQLNFDGTPAGSLATNAIEDRLGRRLRSLRGSTTPATDALYQSLHDGYAGVSKLLVRDVLTQLETIKGVETPNTPFWIPPGGSHFGVDIGGVKVDLGRTWDDSFDLALKLLKSDLTSAIAMEVEGPNAFTFDTHAADGHLDQFVNVRATFDVLGRFLGEMKSTLLPSGKTLLDDTLVLLVSEFARTWPSSGTCDHWPATSVAFVGGGIQGNRMMGGYDVDFATPAANSIGYLGKPVSLIDAGSAVTRVPRSADVLQTALQIMGISNVSIPGGSGEILGIRA